MFRELLNKIFSSRVFYILFSLLVSIALWMYVEINENRELIDSMSVEVVFENEEVMHGRGFFISSHDPPTVTLTFEGPQSVVTRLLRGTITVKIDLANVRSTGHMSLSYEIDYPPDVNSRLFTTTQSVSRITLFVDRLTTKPIPVLVENRTTTVSEDLIIGIPEYDPQSITVSGPEEAVSRIDRAFVMVIRDNLTSTLIDDFEFILLDDDGVGFEDEVLDLLTPNLETIRVTVPVWQMKEIPLEVGLVHGSGATPQNTNYTVDPPVITVSGDPEAIKDFNHITLGTIDTTRFNYSTTEAFQIIIPNYVDNLSNEQEAHVFVEVLGVDLSYYSTSNLHYINTPVGYRADIITETLDVRIRGTQEDLDHITEDNIRVVADLRDLPPGTSIVPARVYVDGTEADVGAVGLYQLTIRIMRE